MRRYEIADVQRRAAGIGVPSSFLQADLDIVSPGGATLTEQTLADAEVLKVRPKCTAPVCVDMQSHEHRGRSLQCFESHRLRWTCSRCCRDAKQWKCA